MNTFAEFEKVINRLDNDKHRLSDAVSLGVKTVYTDVMFGSVYYGNMEGVGFKTAMD